MVFFELFFFVYTQTMALNKKGKMFTTIGLQRI